MAVKKSGLGRGIGALIPTSSETNERPVDVFFSGSSSDLISVPGVNFAQLDPNDIIPNRNQPRTEFREEELAELIHSVKEFGVLQPIVVRQLSEPNSSAKYELIMGERRLRASKAAGLTEIPAVIRDTADENMLRDALLENLHRSQLNPLEEASAYQQLLEDFAITQEQLSDKIGRSRSQIANTIRLLKLPESVQQKVAAGVISAGHARALLSAQSSEVAETLANKIISEELSVRDTEAIVATGKKLQPKLNNKPLAGKKQDQLAEIASRLEDQLDTRVKISLGAKKGQIVIDFATVADLNRILAELNIAGFGK